MEQIINGIYVGGDRDYERVKDRDDFSIVRCCKYGPGGHKDTLQYTTRAAPEGPNKYWVEKGHLIALNLLDLDDPDKIPLEAIKAGLDFAKQQIDKGQKVLFACNEGESRGPTTALLFLRSVGEMPHPFLQSVKVFKTLYHKYEPGLGMKQFARREWGALNDMELKDGTKTTTGTQRK